MLIINAFRDFAEGLSFCFSQRNDRAERTMMSSSRRRQAR